MQFLRLAALAFISQILLLPQPIWAQALTVHGLTVTLKVGQTGYLFDPFSADQTWTVSDGETAERIYQYLSDNKWVSVSLTDFKNTVGGDTIKSGDVLKLKGMLNLSTQTSKQKALAKVLRDQTGVTCDPNPLFHITSKVPIARQASTNLGTRAVPTSTILALWAKEGSLRQTKQIPDPPSILSAVPGYYKTADNAKELFVQITIFDDIGCDYFTLHRVKTGGMADNELKDKASDMVAARAYFKSQVAPFAIATNFDDSIFNEITVTADPLGGFDVQATDLYTTDILELAGALWNSWREPEGEDMTYFRYNGGYQAMKDSLATHPDRAALGLVNWSIHSPVTADAFPTRENGVKFYYYRHCYLQYDP